MVTILPRPSLDKFDNSFEIFKTVKNKNVVVTLTPPEQL